MRSIPDPGFADDLGEADPGLAAALARFDGAPGDTEAHRAVLNRLAQIRLLVPVVALLGEMEGDHEKTSDMAAVLMTGRDGRTALLAFTGTASLQAWNPEARPVPVTARHAARAALQDGGVGAAGRRRRAGDVRRGGRRPPPSRWLRSERSERLETTGPAPMCVEAATSCTLVRDRSVVSTRTGSIRQAEASSHPHRPKLDQVVGSRSRDAATGVARTPVPEASVRRAEAFFRVGAEMRR